jgi:hypothetical protein
MDDPLMWGFIPLKYQFGLSSSNRRWGLASHDICYQTRYDLPPPTDNLSIDVRLTLTLQTVGAIFHNGSTSTYS